LVAAAAAKGSSTRCCLFPFATAEDGGNPSEESDDADGYGGCDDGGILRLAPAEEWSGVRVRCGKLMRGGTMGPALRAAAAAAAAAAEEEEELSLSTGASR